MSTQFWWIFDVLVVAIVAYVIYSNAKRGLTKVLIMNIGYIIATLLASVLSIVAAPTLYESVARSSDITAFQTVNSKIDFTDVFVNAIDAEKYGFEIDPNRVETILRSKDGNYDAALFAYTTEKVGTEPTTPGHFSELMRDAFVRAYSAELSERLPRYALANFRKQVTENPEVVSSMVYEICASGKSAEEIAESLEDAFALEPTKEVLRIFVYLIIFSILMVIAALIGAMMENRLFFNLRKSSEHSLGALLGLIEAGAMITLFTIIVRLLVQLGGGDLLCFNDPTIEESKIFSFFYDHLSVLL